MEIQDIEVFYRETYKKKVKVVSFILGGDSVTAEDVVQESFARMIKYKHIFNEDKASVDTWFNSIMFRVLWDIRREEQHIPSHENSDLSDEDRIEHNKIQDSPEFRQYLLKKIGEVDNKIHKKILTLVFLFGYSSKEISEMGLGVSQTNVTTIVHRFRSQLT